VAATVGAPTGTDAPDDHPETDPKEVHGG
jgi:hypothetical protein